MVKVIVCVKVIVVVKVKFRLSLSLSLRLSFGGSFYSFTMAAMVAIISLARGRLSCTSLSLAS